MSLELKPAQQEVPDRAFTLIHDQIRNEDWVMDDKESTVNQIEEGFAQAVRGELIDAEQAIGILRDRRAKRRIA
jgi:hypothetical protein